MCQHRSAGSLLYDCVIYTEVSRMFVTDNETVVGSAFVCSESGQETHFAQFKLYKYRYCSVFQAEPHTLNQDVERVLVNLSEPLFILIRKKH